MGKVVVVIIVVHPPATVHGCGEAAACMLRLLELSGENTNRLLEVAYSHRLARALGILWGGGQGDVCEGEAAKVMGTCVRVRQQRGYAGVGRLSKKGKVWASSRQGGERYG